VLSAVLRTANTTGVAQKVIKKPLNNRH